VNRQLGKYVNPFFADDISAFSIYCRLLSAWFYHGHSPNNDYFQVRPYFKDIRDGKLPKVTFEEYIEMPEYQNIITRMLGADSFPYRNITVTDKVKNLWSCSFLFIPFLGLSESYRVG
jgi:hypothetical protein